MVRTKNAKKIVHKKWDRPTRPPIGSIEYTRRKRKAPDLTDLSEPPPIAWLNGPPKRRMLRKKKKVQAIRAAQVAPTVPGGTGSILPPSPPARMSEAQSDPERSPSTDLDHPERKKRKRATVELPTGNSISTLDTQEPIPDKLPLFGRKPWQKVRKERPPNDKQQKKKSLTKAMNSNFRSSKRIAYAAAPPDRQPATIPIPALANRRVGFRTVPQRSNNAPPVVPTSRPATRQELAEALESIAPRTKRRIVKGKRIVNSNRQMHRSDDTKTSVSCVSSTKDKGNCKKQTRVANLCWIHLKDKKGIRVTKSTGPGKGLVAAKVFQPGEKIANVQGTIQHKRHGSNSVRIGVGKFLNIKKTRGGRYLAPGNATKDCSGKFKTKSHCSGNNAHFVDRDRKAYVVASRKINPGEEVLASR